MKRRRFLSLVGAALGAAAVAQADALVRGGQASELEVLGRLRQPRGMVMSDGGVWRQKLGPTSIMIDGQVYTFEVTTESYLSYPVGLTGELPFGARWDAYVRTDPRHGERR